MVTNRPWRQRIGNQREWIWRGWQIRFSYIREQNHLLQSDRPPLIFIHGFGASIEHWRHNLPVLSQKYTVYALDLLGFGASRKARVNYSANLWTEQVYDFWQTFIGQPVVLVGNSIGSLVSLNLTWKYPEMVRGLVMLSLPDVSVRQEILPKPLRPVVTTLENLVASPLLIKNLLKILRKPSVIRRWAGVAYYDKNAITNELVQILSNPAYDRGAEQTLYALSRSIRQAGFAAPIKEVLPQIKDIPMLLIWGLKDRMIPPQQADEFVTLNPHLELIKLENVGHCPHDECPDKFNAILLDWLAKTQVK
ncbi:MAG: alpha/beta fold hydrolase [Pleurocapsa sp.]